MKKTLLIALSIFLVACSDSSGGGDVMKDALVKVEEGKTNYTMTFISDEFRSTINYIAAEEAYEVQSTQYIGVVVNTTYKALKAGDEIQDLKFADQKGNEQQLNEKQLDTLQLNAETFSEIYKNRIIYIVKDTYKIASDNYLISGNPIDVKTSLKGNYYTYKLSEPENFASGPGTETNVELAKDGSHFNVTYFRNFLETGRNIFKF